MNILLSEKMFPVVETSTGAIRGLANTGVNIFRGIPYGEDTSVRRFQPPVARRPWAGVRDCFGPGPVAPQVPLPLTSLFSQLIHYEMAVADGGMSEDCLSLNIWTQGGRGHGRRPIIVVLHGGGYAHSSGNAAFYDGAQLALEQDVMVASINHRLGVFGYLGLAGLGVDERFAHAGHCGLLDLILALEWLRDNAEAFGGDPGRIMLLGESGGGWKVSALMATPAACGLFHRAVVQSGSGPGPWSVEEGAALAAGLLAELGLDRGRADQLLTMDYTHLLAAQAKLGPVMFLPVLHPEVLPAQPLAPAGMAVSRSVPLIVSTTREDAGLFFADFDLDEAGLAALLMQHYGAVGADLLSIYRERFPRQTPYLLHARMVTDAGFRRYADAQVAGKAALGGASVWMYRWDWPSPAWGGRFGATHAMDVSASLAHPRDALLGGGTATGCRLATALSAAMAGFAAHGTPATTWLPDWPAWTTDQRTCLLLGDADQLANDPDGDLRAIWESIMDAPRGLLG